jgi:hypothetical protein
MRGKLTTYKRLGNSPTKPSGYMLDQEFQAFASAEFKDRRILPGKARRS